MLRVLRVLRLMRKWRGLYIVLSTFLRAIPQMTNLVLLTALTMFIFALLGMELFGGAFTPEAGYSLQPCTSGGVCDEPGLVEKPLMHFDYFGPVRRSDSRIPAPLSYLHRLSPALRSSAHPEVRDRGPSLQAFITIFVSLTGEW